MALAVGADPRCSCSFGPSEATDRRSGTVLPNQRMKLTAHTREGRRQLRCRDRCNTPQRIRATLACPQESQQCTTTI